MMLRDDEDSEYYDSDIEDILEDNGIPIYESKIEYPKNYGGAKEKINDALVEAIDIIKARLNSDQLELKFESWKVEKDNGDETYFKFFVRPSGRDNTIEIVLYADVHNVPPEEQKKYTELIKYILDKKGAELIDNRIYRHVNQR